MERGDHWLRTIGRPAGTNEIPVTLRYTLPTRNDNIQCRDGRSPIPGEVEPTWPDRGLFERYGVDGRVKYPLARTTGGAWVESKWRYCPPTPLQMVTIERLRVRATVRGTGSRVREATPWHYRLEGLPVPSPPERGNTNVQPGLTDCTPQTNAAKGVGSGSVHPKHKEEDREAHQPNPHSPGQGTAVRGGAEVWPGR